MQDSLDCKILEHLIDKGRITWAELANILGLSAPAIADRIRRLEEKGVIKGYTTKVDYKVLGYSLTAFVSVSLSHPKYQEKFLEAVHTFDEIQECYHVLGNEDYLMKVRCFNTEHLDSFLHGNLKLLPGVTKARTTIVLSPIKELSSVILKNKKLTKGYINNTDIKSTKSKS